MRRILYYILCFFFILSVPVFVNAQNDKTETAEEEILSVSDQAPTFVLRSLDGQVVFLKDYAGVKLRPSIKNKANKDLVKHVVMLSFFASWCKPCKKEIPIIQEIHESFKDKPLKTFLINETDEEDVAKALVAQEGYTLPVLMDKFGTTAKNYGVADAAGRATLPRLFVIDKNGNVQLINKGFDGNEEEFRHSLTTLIEQLIAEETGTAN